MNFRQFAILTFLLSCIFLKTNAQGLYDQKMAGPYVMLFQLDQKQAAYAVKYPYKLDTSYLYTHKVGEISSDSLIPLFQPQLTNYPIKALCSGNYWHLRGTNNNRWNLTQNGYFIEVSVLGINQVNYKLIENPIFHPAILRVGYETFVFVEDSAGLPVLDAIVKLDTFTCAYDPGVGGYHIPRNNISGTLWVSKNANFTVNPVNGYQNSGNNSAPPRDHFKYAKNPYQGYLVHNKPAYKTGDTLFFKAYIVNKRAKALREKLTARLFQNSTGKASVLELKPNPRGAYSGWFVVGDSFKTDDYLGLNLLNSKGQSVMYRQIKLENYQLQDIQLSARPNRNVLSPGAGLTVFVTSTSKTGLPVLDGTIELKLSISDIRYTASDSFVISISKMANFFQAHQQTDASGITVFEIPAEIFPDLKGTYYCTVTLLTSDNERKSYTFVFSSETTRDRTLAKLESDTLKVDHLHNMVSVSRSVRVKLFSRYDLVKDTTITTPFSLYLPPNINTAQLFKGDTSVGFFYRQTDIPDIVGKRSHDSVHIEFHSKNDVPVFYRIYRNNDLVLSGNDTVLLFAARDKSKNSYHIQYGVLAGSVSQPRFYSQSFHLAEKNLEVRIQQPETIYPGQEVAVEIFVKNAYGKPVKNVNLTAWAANMQLEGITKPDMPYLGKVKEQKALPIIPFTVGQFQYTQSSVMHDWIVPLLKLRKNQIYTLAYPEKGMQVLTDTTPDHSTQIEFYNHSYGLYSPVKYVKFNDTFVYMDPYTPKPGVLKVEPGTYTVEVRLYDRLVAFKNVTITKGKKNFFCLNADTLQLLNLGDTLSPGKYSSIEYQDILNHTMLFRYDYWLSDTLLIQHNGKLHYAMNNGYIHQFAQVYTNKPQFNTTTLKTTYTALQGFFAYGPVNKWDLLSMSWKNHYAHEFVFQESATYSFTSKDNVTALRDSIRAGQAYFSKFSSWNYNLNTFWWDPYAPIKAQKVVEPYNWNQGQLNLTEYQYKDYYPAKNHLLSTLNLFIPQSLPVRKIWLFNVGDSSLSQLQSSVYNQENIVEAGMNAYRYNQAATDSGRYKKFILAVQSDDTTWLVKPLIIDSSVWLMYTAKPEDFRKLKSSEYIQFDRMAKILGREPFAFFEDTPSIDKNLRLVKIPSAKGNTSLEGTINGPDLKYVAANAFVILEKNGYFVRGALSNSDGRFRMDSLEPGVYMLKIKANDYHYWIAYNLPLEKGKLHLLNVNLKPFSRFQYNTVETVFDDHNGWNYGDDNISMSYSASPNGAFAYSADEMAVVKTGKKMKSLAILGISDKENTKDREGRYMVRKMVAEDTDSDGDGVEDVFQGYISTRKAIPEKQITSADTTMLNAMARNANAQRLRKRFQDYAYWIPNLTTNKQGYATYSVTFPDNITSWQTWVPAMDAKRHTGLGEQKVKSFKPVSASLAVPSFLFEGDELTLWGRINNYTGSPLKGTYQLLHDSSGITKTIDLTDVYKESLKVKAGLANTILHVQSGFSMGNGYRDIESRDIPVFAGSVLGGKSAFFLLRKDTILRFAGKLSDESRTVTVYEQQLAMIFDLLRNQSLAIYPDNQTLTNNLDALLTEKAIADKLKIDFEKDDEIKAIVKKLRNAQFSDGLFGIFRSGRPDPNLSTYSAEVLYRANVLGYSNNAWLNTAKYYEKMLPNLYNEECLHALLILKRLDRNLKYQDFLPRINPKNLGLTDQIQYQILLGKLGKKTNIGVVTENISPSAQGNLYINYNQAGLFRYMPYWDNSSNTWLAWELLNITDQEKDVRMLLAQWMANEASGGSRNATRAAKMLFQESQNEAEKDKTMEVRLNGKQLMPNEFPKTTQIGKTDTLALKHTGAPVYVLYNETFRTYEPISDTSIFRIHSSIMNGSSWHGGTYEQVEVVVFSKAHQSNVVLEIPIPAGCIFASKNQNENSFEIQREYQQDRVLIYLNEIPFGYTKFHFTLLPKYTGTFQVPPGRVSLMFYPEQAAYTSKVQIVIE